MTFEAGKTEPQKRIDGLWLAKVRGIPLMLPDYSNRVFPSREAAEAAINKEISE